MAKATINKSIEINAPADKVWQVMTERKYFLDWTMAFMPPGSNPEDMVMEGEFGPEADLVFKGKEGTGMRGKVVVWEPDKELKTEYVSEFFNNEESTDNTRENTWIGSHEGYRLSEENGKTTLEVEQTMPESDAKNFDSAWDKALARIKELSEE